MPYKTILFQEIQYRYKHKYTVQYIYVLFLCLIIYIIKQYYLIHYKYNILASCVGLYISFKKNKI